MIVWNEKEAKHILFEIDHKYSVQDWCVSEGYLEGLQFLLQSFWFYGVHFAEILGIH